jgi:F-type H+-transporting ATPase subunit b
MRRRAAWAALVLIAALMAAPVSAAEEGGHDAHAGVTLWKTANFLVLAAGLGWLARKYGGPFFRERTRSIRRQMVEAEEVRAEADRRTAEVEARLANLEAEIEAMRKEALAAQQAESERFSRQLAADMAKIQEHAEAEIEGAGKQARLELKRYAAELAVELAERRIRERMTPEIQDALVGSFVREIERPSGSRPL